MKKAYVSWMLALLLVFVVGVAYGGDSTPDELSDFEPICVQQVKLLVQGQVCKSSASAYLPDTVTSANGTLAWNGIGDQQPDGVGNVLIFPYYRADDVAKTTFRIVNTSNTDSTSVHVVFRSQGSSEEMYDFCVNLSPNDVYVGEIRQEGDSVVMEALNGSDCPLKPDWCSKSSSTVVTAEAGDFGAATGDVATLIQTDRSVCGFDPKVGYIVAYETPFGCSKRTWILGSVTRDGEPGNAVGIAGEEEIVTGTNNVYALNAVALEGYDCNDRSCESVMYQAQLAKEVIYGFYKYNQTALVLTVPSINFPQANANIAPNNVSAFVGGNSVVGNTPPMCGVHYIDNMAFIDIYNLDEKDLANGSPDYYPINEVSIVNFADGDSANGGQYNMRDFFLSGQLYNGSIVALSSGNMLTTGEEGWFRWKVQRPTNSIFQNDPDNPKYNPNNTLQNVIATYFIISNGNLAWLPAQYRSVNSICRDIDDDGWCD